MKVTEHPLIMHEDNDYSCKLFAWHAVGQWKTGRWTIEELRTFERNIRAFKKVICLASTPVPSAEWTWLARLASACIIHTVMRLIVFHCRRRG